MNKKEKERYARMQLKSGWDVPPGEKPPLTGRKQKLARAYELLVLKSDEELAGQNCEKAASENKGPEIKSCQPGRTHQPQYNENPVVELDTLSEQAWRRKKLRRTLFALSVVLVIILVVGGRILFGPAILVADISGYRESEVEIEGLLDEPFTVTIDEIARMKKTSLHMDVHNGELSADEEPLSGDAIGPTLETFLKKYGKTVDDFRSMRVYSGNDQSKAYARTMKEEEIILSVANGKKALGEKQVPLCIATDSEEPSEWRGWVRKIVFSK